MKSVAELLALADRTPGFMPAIEGRALFDLGLAQGLRAADGTWLEIGSYCGKSSVYLGAAARQSGTVLFSLDHHRGSEELQVGWEHHDPSLVDARTQRMNSLPTWQRTIELAELEDTVIGIVGTSSIVAPHFHQRLDLLFIDGGHSREMAWADFRLWAPRLRPGGFLLIHDVFEDPNDGGRPPFEIYTAAVNSAYFVDESREGSLRALVRVK